MISLRKVLGGIGIAAALALPGDVKLPKYVDWGCLEYSREPLRSDSYYTCSAVALDCGEDGFLAHAYSISGPINVANVVDELVVRCRRLDIEPGSCQALVNAGKEQDLERLEEDLTRKGIPIRIANKKGAPEPSDRNPKGRSVYFNPRTDGFQVCIDTP